MTRRSRRRVRRACHMARMLVVPVLLLGAVTLWMVLS